GGTSRHLARHLVSPDCRSKARCAKARQQNLNHCRIDRTADCRVAACPGALDVTPQRKDPNTPAGVADACIVDQVRILRRTYWERGYRPVPIWSPGAENDRGEAIASAGKRPLGHDWRQKALRDPPAAVTDAVSSVALNTGILADQVAAVDIDVPVQP